MNGYEKFLELPNEKQLRIINAGFYNGIVI